MLYTNFYTSSLTDLAYDYLGKAPLKEEWDRKRLVSLYSMNKVFTSVCYKYRYEYVIDWVTEPEEGPSGVCVVWRDKIKKMAKESMIFEQLQTMVPNDQLKEIKEIIEKYAGREIEDFPSVPNVYVTVIGKEDVPLKVVEMGQPCVTDDNILQWISR